MKVEGRGVIRDQFAGMTVSQILATKKSSVQKAPLTLGSPSWSSIMQLTWEELDEAARKNQAGFKTIRKLSTDSRFDR